MSTPYAVPWHRPMSGRDTAEEGRASSPLELFLDLCFVVAVAAAAAGLHDHLAEGALIGLLWYALVFFGIWWAWVNYSWFASAYDTGDVMFRVSTFVVMTGVLTMAAGIPRAMADQNFGVLVIGYIIMRLALVPLWFRASREDPSCRFIARRYAVGIVILQILWVLRTWALPEGAFSYVVFAVLVVGELSLPYFAERLGPGEATTPWHRDHIADRYSAFTIIVLGEVILATTGAISGTLDKHGLTPQLSMLILGGLLIVFSLWWLYFKRPLEECLQMKTAFWFGYTHYFIFAAVAAVGASMSAGVDVVEHRSEALTARAELMVLAGALALYALCLALIHSLADRSVASLRTPALVAAALLLIPLLIPTVGLGVLLMGVVLAVAVAWHTSSNQPVAGSH